jgi:hypothetical protein
VEGCGKRWVGSPLVGRATHEARETKGTCAEEAAERRWLWARHEWETANARLPRSIRPRFVPVPRLLAKRIVHPVVRTDLRQAEPLRR